MADVKISALSTYKPLEDTTIIPASWKDAGGNYTTRSLSGAALREFVISKGLEAGTGIKITSKENATSDPSTGNVFVISTDLDLSLFTIVPDARIPSEIESYLGTPPSKNKIYLLKDNDTSTYNKYVEYIYTDTGWEMFGKHSETISLDGFYTKDEIDRFLEEFEENYTKNNDFGDKVNEVLSTKDYITKSEVETNYLLKSEYNPFKTEVISTLTSYNSRIEALENANFITEQDVDTKLKDLQTSLNECVRESDLTEKLKDYATQQWVKDQGYLTSTNIEDMATQTWVTNQGYLTEVPEEYANRTEVAQMIYDAIVAATDDEVYVTLETFTTAISNLASMNWVESQGYLTEVPSNYPTTSKVAQMIAESLTVNDEKFATIEWVESCGYITEVPEEYDNHIIGIFDNMMEDYPSRSEISRLTDLVQGYENSVNYLQTALNTANSKISTLEEKVEALETQLKDILDKFAKYDARFGYPEEGSDEWTTGFLRVDDED